MILDHFVVHVDNDMEALCKLSEQSKHAGFPFDPQKGKGTSGFKVANLWVGSQYFELPWLKQPEGGGWRRDWVDLYNSGERGIFCIFLKTNSLDDVDKDLRSRGIKGVKEKVTFRSFFGLLKKTMPWTCLHLPRFKNSNLEISFIEYEPGIMDEYLKFMKPNSKDSGIEGIHEARIELKSFTQNIDYIKNLFPKSKIVDENIVDDLTPGQLVFARGHKNKVTLYGHSNVETFEGKSFWIEDVEIRVRRISGPSADARSTL